jgi:hypothetical protein
MSGGHWPSIIRTPSLSGNRQSVASFQLVRNPRTSRKYSALLSHDQDDCRGDGPATNTVRRVLQDLTAYGVARQGQGEGNPDLWGPPRQPTKETKKSATAEAGSAPDVEFTPRGKAVDSPGSVFISRSDFLNDDSGSPLGEFCRLR